MNNKPFSYTLWSAVTAALIAATPAIGLAADSAADTYRTDSQTTQIRQDASKIQQDARDLKNDVNSDMRNMKTNVQNDMRDMKNNAKADMRDMKNDMTRTTGASMDNSDSAVTDRVERALQSYKDVDVSTDKGVVKLTGSVKSNQDRDAAVTRTRSVSGVTQVKDELKIDGQKSEGVGQYIDDASITTVVKGKFLGQKGLDSMDISVETADGVVTLTGEVDNPAQVSLAEGVAKEADGVKAVVNKITTKR